MRKLILLLIVLLVPASLFAQDEGWRNRRGGYRDRYRDRNMFELTPFGGYRYGGTIFADQTALFGGRDVKVASAGNYGVNFGIPIGDWKLELMVNRQDTHFTSGGGLFSPSERFGGFHVTYFHGGLQIPFAVSRTATPYFIVSAGLANLDPHVAGATSDNRFSAGAGIGVKVPINRNVGIRIEERGYFTSLSNYGDSCRSCYYSYNHDLYQGETNVGIFLRF
jgi:outer membrane protein with beta-barrel domain